MYGKGLGGEVDLAESQAWSMKAQSNKPADRRKDSEPSLICDALRLHAVRHQQHQRVRDHFQLHREQAQHFAVGFDE